jgi:predicted HTH domain antitoxin
MKRLLNLFLIVAGIFLFTSCHDESYADTIGGTGQVIKSNVVYFPIDSQTIVKISIEYHHLFIDTIKADKQKEFFQYIKKVADYASEGDGFVSFGDILEINGKSVSDYNSEIEKTNKCLKEYDDELF